MLSDKYILQKEPILEYKEHKGTSLVTLFNEKDHFIMANNNVWILPFGSKFIDTGLQLWIPDGSIGLITRNNFGKDKIYFDPLILGDDSSYRVCILVRNRSILPVKIKTEDILAKLTIIKKTEYHTVNIGEQS